MTLPSGDGLNVAAALAELRGDMNTGFERITGQLDRMADRADTVSRDLETLARRVDGIESDTDGRLTALEDRRFPLGVLGALAGVVSAVVALVAVLATLLAGQ